MEKFGDTYVGSHTWFEARIKQKITSSESTQGKDQSHTRDIQRNVHASWTWRKHIKIWDFKSQEPGTKEWLELLKPGDQILVYAMALYPGWVNYVRYVRVDVYCEK